MNAEDRLRIFSRDGYKCQECGATPGISGLQIAHQIRKGKGSEKYIKGLYPDLKLNTIREIINHPDNLVTTCSLKCNGKQNIFFNPVKRDRLLNQIIKKVMEGAA